jgi:hypothetical protein
MKEVKNPIHRARFSDGVLIKPQQFIIEWLNDLLPGALKWLHEFPSPSPLPKAWGEG